MYHKAKFAVAIAPESPPENTPIMSVAIPANNVATTVWFAKLEVPWSCEARTVGIPSHQFDLEPKKCDKMQ
jgi:hypothetical protein